MTEDAKTIANALAAATVFHQAAGEQWTAFAEVACALWATEGGNARPKPGGRHGPCP